MSHVCKNPECNESYELKEDRADDGFCSFGCWEKVNCLEPEEVEEYQIAD